MTPEQTKQTQIRLLQWQQSDQDYALLFILQANFGNRQLNVCMCVIQFLKRCSPRGSAVRNHGCAHPAQCVRPHHVCSVFACTCTVLPVWYGWCHHQCPVTLQSPTATFIPLFSSSEYTGWGYPGLLDQKKSFRHVPPVGWMDGWLAILLPF